DQGGGTGDRPEPRPGAEGGAVRSARDRQVAGAERLRHPELARERATRLRIARRIALLAARAVDGPVAAARADLDHTRRRAAVAGGRIAVVAGFARTDDAVAAGFEPACGAAAVAIGRVPVVARLAGVGDAIAACRDGQAGIAAQPGGGRVADLAAGGVDDPVAAAQPRLGLARRRAAVARVGVASFLGFAAAHDPV